jgi:magnesium-transporting ATPase (P-type)
MFETSKDILNIALAVGFGLIALFLSIALFYAIFVLRDLSETTKALKVTAKHVNQVIVQPAKIATMLFSKIKHVAELVEKHATKKSRRG